MPSSRDRARAADTKETTTMKSRTMIQATLAAALLIAATPVAFAQPPGGQRGWHGPGRDGGHDLTQFLGLTAEQQAQWKQVHQQHFEALRPTFEKMRDLRDQLQSELDSASPDPATVGGYVISMHQLEAEMKASRADLDNAIKGILTDEQQSKLEAWKAANPDHGPGGFGWGGPRHDRRGGGAPPPGDNG
jgi:Spy/CpxP family protein refolding chaperone